MSVLTSRLLPSALLATALVLAAALLSGRTLFEAGFYPAHDNNLNLHRLHQMEKCLRDGQIPCRWVPDMGYGYGYPLFNFYPPLPSYVGQIPRALGATYTATVKLLMLAGLVVSGLAMLALAWRYYGVGGATLAAIFYTWAPYRATDVFVRGALNEAWGLALLPLLFWTGREILASERAMVWWALACASAWAALLLTHVGVAMMITPAYAVWCLLHIRPIREPRRLLIFALAHGLALVLAAHFILPLLLERQYAHTDSLIALYPWTRYASNFLSASELLTQSPSWDYGPFRSPGGMSVFIGGLHWIVATVSALVVAALALRERRLDQVGAAVIFSVVLGWLAAFMTLEPSRAIWQAAPPLAYLQFPWRFVGVAVFGFSLACGWPVFATAARPWAAAAFGTTLATLLVATSWQYFEPKLVSPIADVDLVNELRISRTRHGLFDYLPRSVDIERFPKSPPASPPEPVEVIEGSLRLRDVRRESDQIAFTAEVATGRAIARINTYAFPGWTLEVDGQEVAPEAIPDPLGRLHVSIGPGRHEVRASFQDTPVRAWGNRLTAAGLAALLVGAIAASRAKSPSNRFG